MDFELNPRIYVFIILLGIIMLIIGGTPYLFPHRLDSKINQTNQSNVTIVYKFIEKLVTPTPDGHIYFASEYQNGTRLLQRPFSWIRYNASGTMDMKVTTIIYDYKMFNKLHAFNPDDWKYDEILPETGKKFLFIFPYVFMDDIIGDDTRMWMFNRNFFAVYNGKDTFRPKVYPYQIRFKELENTPTFNQEMHVQSFKSIRMYDFNPDYFSTAGEYNDEIYYLRGGQSNAVDGYLIYEIDEKDNPEDLLVLAQFYAFGSAQWRLRA